MDNNELQHHGIKGQKWGRRRFQNLDGSLTEAGKKRYDVDSDSSSGAKVVPGKKPLYNTKNNKTPVDKGDFSPESFAAAKIKTEARLKVLAKNEKTEPKNKPKAEKQKEEVKSNKPKSEKQKEEVKSDKQKEGTKPESNNTKEPKKPSSAKEAKAVGSAATLAGQATKEAGVNIHRATVKAKNAQDMKDYKNMTNAELKAEIERIRLENDYVNVSMAKMTAAQHKTESVISIIGNSLNVVGGAANAYAAIMSILKKD